MLLERLPGIAAAVSFNHLVPMRDGVRLATDIWRPVDDAGQPLAGPLPTILCRTSYDKTNAGMQIRPVAEAFVPQGYAVVLQDLRGRGLSEGVGGYYHTANPLEGQDGHDTIEWIARQPWSNGRVGMVGSSHSGICQNVAALHHPPHLTALWVDVAPTTAIEWEARQGGAQAMQMYAALYMHAFDAPEIRNDPVARKRIEDGVSQLRQNLMKMPFKPGGTPLAAVPNLEEVLFRYAWEGTINDWWRMEAMDQKSRMHTFPDIPVVLSAGWYDPFVYEVVDQFATLSRKNKSATRLIVGPWNHGAMRSGASVIGEVEFGAAARWGSPVYNRERLRWFDRWLKDKATGVEADPPIRLFVMGGDDGRKNATGHYVHGGRWRAEKEWPLARAVETAFYLHADGSLTADAPAAGEPARSWTHDPTRPVPTIGGSFGSFHEWAPLTEGIDATHVHPRGRLRGVVPEGAMHQRERPSLLACAEPFPLLAERSDVLVFQTEPLTGDVEVTGPILLHLWLASSATDTDVTAKLVDVYPPDADTPEGLQLNLTDTILRARFRDGLEHESLMVPGTAYAMTLRFAPISNLFKAGHRIRLDIASSNFPRFDVNPGTGEPLGRHTGSHVTRNTLFLDAERVARLLLPIIPTDR